MHEWKIGDRFTLEFEVTEIDKKNKDAPVRARVVDGVLEWWIYVEYFKHAKLIQPAHAEPQKLDTSKPMRRKGTENEMLRYLHENPLGQIYCRDAAGYVVWAFADDLENIQTPKITGRREAVLVEDGSVYWGDNFTDSIHRLLLDLRVVGRAWVEIAQGDGMEEEK